MCPAAVNLKHKMKSSIDTSARSIAARLNSVAPGANLNPTASMHLCPFETAVTEKLSSFYSMFSEEDFEIYEYAGTSRNSTIEGAHISFRHRWHVAHCTVR